MVFTVERGISVKPADQRAGEVVGRKRTAKEAGEGNGHLNGGEKTGGLRGQPAQLFGAFVALLGKVFQRGFVCADHRDFGTGKHCVQGDQNHLQQ